MFQQMAYKTIGMKYFLFLFFIFFTTVSFGQDSYTLKFLPQLQQSQWINSSNVTDAKVSIGLPVISSVSFYIFNSGFTYHDMFHRINDTSMGVDMGNLFSKLKKQNYVGFGTGISLFSINIAKNNVSCGFSITDKMSFQFSYPGDLFNLLWYGNGAYLGKTLEIGNFGINASWYREYALHGTYAYKKWTFGFSPKILFGKTNINTQETSVKLYTDPNFYNLTATANINVQTSGIPDTTDTKNGFLNGSNQVLSYVFNNQNRGLAMDLGAKYDISDKLNVSAGINDLGYIKWKSTVHNYKSGPSSFVFDGLHADTYFQGDSSAISSQTLTDSISKLVKFSKNSNAYTTYLPYSFFMMANYKLKHHWFGLQFNTQRFNKDFIYSGTLCYQLKLGKHFTGALTYTAKSYNPANIGGAIILQFAKMQWYIITDNWYAAVKPLDSKSVNLNLGMNLVFGNRIKKQKQNEAIDTEPILTPVQQ